MVSIHSGSSVGVKVNGYALIFAVKYRPRIAYNDNKKKLSAAHCYDGIFLMANIYHLQRSFRLRKALINGYK